MLTEAPMLTQRESNKEFTVYNDASLNGLGCLLIQEGKEIAYASRQLKPHKRNSQRMILSWKVTKESINCLGLGDSLDVQARDLLDQLVPDSVAQHNSVAAVVAIDPLPCPDRSKRKLLWEGLKSVIPNQSILWLIMGDFNAILSLADKKSPFTVDHDILQSKTVEFFERLYGEAPPILRDIPIVGFPCLNSSEITFSKVAITNEDIKRALFDMAPLKALGSDSFYAHFFQSQWDILGNDEQASFIVERNISDNIILTQEVIHSMRCNQKGRKWMTIKLDLKKDYDRVSWEFISASLITAGIPVFLRNMIMSAISSSSMQILWNGMLTQKFKLIRGIHQRCPLSPYLFVLYMEWLGHFIRAEIEIDNWVPIRLSRTGPAVSHLFFVDDLEVQNIGTYLGVPLLHDRVTKNTMSFFVDKIRKKLQSWDARKLSIAGRITLAQSVLLSIPNYFMQPLMIPKGVCADIERLVRQFIWGCTDGHLKMSLVGWYSICQPRARGGLGFRHLNDQNLSFLMKIGFSLVSKSNALWVRVLCAKYGWKEQFPDSISRNQCSHLWKALSKIWPLLRENLVWSIGDGATACCWKDP
ncbi:uncharacterized protein [Gossypium hirsutum]|uniref:Reverse transcriptase n=1 Tax=Gossypium hirsutum TaxID=3635 RepID=A0A1U8IM59_GOSHI|nr:uncharacterized protein LOC107898167 [Gossypium hirsutum]